MAVLGSHHGLVLVALADELHYLVVNRREVLGAAAVTHVVCVVIQREHGTEKLRVLGRVDLEPFPTVTGSLIDALYALKIGVPIPLYTHLLLDPGDALFHILGCVVENIGVFVAHGGCQLEGRDTVLPLKALCNDAVAHE